MSGPHYTGGAFTVLRDRLEVYGLKGSLRLARDIIVTRLFFREARILRQPYYIRGRRHIRLGANLTTGIGLRLDAFGEHGNDKVLIKIGADVQLNDHVHIAAREWVEIGDECLIASRVFISDHNHGSFDLSDPAHGPDTPPTLRPERSKPVIIGKRVWIGESVLILPGITVGDGAVIGGGSVVTRDVPAQCVVAGNPARVLRRYDPATSRWERV